MKAFHEGKRWTCQECRKEFTHPNSLNKHTASVHKGVRYPCDQCDKSFTQKQSLKVHVQSIHKENTVHKIANSNIEESKSSMILPDIKEEL